MQVSISAAQWYPLSAEYQYDSNIDLKPTMTYWRDGYRMIHHPIFQYARDVTANQQTIFYLSTAGSFFDFAEEKVFDYADLGTYITFNLGGSYISSLGNSLILSGLEVDETTFFRIIPNENGTYSFLNGTNKYVTVDRIMPYNLTLSDPLDLDNIDLQQFKIFSPRLNQIYITTYFDTPTPGYGADIIQRYWSYSPVTSAMRCIGMNSDDDYAMSNNYIFDVDNFNLIFTLDGLTRDQTWIHYYNSLVDKTNNFNLELYEERCISGIDLSRLIDLPYHSQINLNDENKIGSFNINFANLKNVLTPEYEQNVKSY